MPAPGRAGTPCFETWTPSEATKSYKAIGLQQPLAVSQPFGLLKVCAWPSICFLVMGCSTCAPACKAEACALPFSCSAEDLMSLGDFDKHEARTLPLTPAWTCEQGQAAAGRMSLKDINSRLSAKALGAGPALPVQLAAGAPARCVASGCHTA